MAKKEFTFRGKTLDEVKKLSTQEFVALIPSNQRRKFKRGFTEKELKLLAEIRSGKNNIETHCRDMLILPEMVGMTVKVHNGKEFFPIMITEDMLGHRFGEFALTRRTVRHGSAGVGATRGSMHASVH
ncbi:MAG TPA: 30S ribosomal protein S19 [Candidatus Nanoarchaeia archaeon]|nr:30S ribosomal protein S19 [Candidatus Nanoarchaeia archaeon]